jgi:predicted transglutaminase-like cysteine proteinase
MKRIVATIFIFLVGLFGLAGCQTSSVIISPQVLSSHQALLIAWNPFSEKEIIPLWKAVAERITYVSDGPTGDVWQHPKVTYYARVGDCEDMNLLLASALLAEGHDACLVVGTTVPEERYINHAWVLLKLNGKSYYLDATSIYVPTTLDGYTIEKWKKWHVRYVVRPIFNRNVQPSHLDE